jgi:hypothetical protein
MYKTLRLWVGVIALYAMLSSFALCAQELRNPSFEDPLDANQWVSDRAAGWERWGGWFNRETSWSPVRDGQCLAAYHHWRIQGDEPSGLYQDIEGVPAGHAYTFSIQVFKDKLTNAEYIEVRLETLKGGTTLASQIYRMNDLRSGKWNELSVTGIPTTPGIRVLVVAKPGRAVHRKGSLKFDSAALLADPVSASDTMRAMPANSLRRR